MIVIIDYGVGNLGSILNMLKRIGEPAIISSDKNEIQNATKLILPGVGSFDYGMNQLNNSGIIKVLNKKVLQDKTPVLGICLGAQMLGNESAEGTSPGLGWIDMDVVKFDLSRMSESLKIPHMCWNEIVQNKESALFHEMNNDPRFYFVHSYHMKPPNNNDILCTSVYGYEFVSGVQHENIYGVQFHPEKSHKFGIKLLENFVKYC